MVTCPMTSRDFKSQGRVPDMPGRKHLENRYWDWGSVSKAYRESNGHVIESKESSLAEVCTVTLCCYRCARSRAGDVPS